MTFPRQRQFCFTATQGFGQGYRENYEGYYTDSFAIDGYDFVPNLLI